jgi:hypothetical protein
VAEELAGIPQETRDPFCYWKPASLPVGFRYCRADCFSS